MNPHFDLLIRNGTVIDGTGDARFAADVAVRDGLVERIGSLDAFTAAEEVDAAGRIVAPGFIDAHTHDDRMLLSGAGMTAKVSQGVTTVVAGNCGISLAPLPGGMRGAVTPPLDLLDDDGRWFRFASFAAYVDALREAPAATNCALLVGHTTLRVATLEDVQRPASAAQIERMRGLVHEALTAGAIGMSTGLYYEPAAAAPTQEIIEVGRPLTEFDALYCTHMRNEADRVMQSLDESFAIARALGVAVVISHHKVNGIANHGRSTQTLAFIAERMREQPIGLDAYPYCAASTILSADRAAFASRTLVTWSKPHPESAGMDVTEVARRMQLPQDEAIAQLLPAGAIYFSMDEQDVQRILAFPPTMIGSDGLPHDSVPHPRLWATFPRVLGHYSRDVGLFSLEQAVHKMTGLTAQTFGLPGRGVLREGAWADIAIFDAESIAEGGDFEYPARPAQGIDMVIVNGVPVWRDGAGTGARPGQVLRRER